MAPQQCRANDASNTASQHPQDSGRHTADSTGTASFDEPKPPEFRCLATLPVPGGQGRPGSQAFARTALAIATTLLRPSDPPGQVPSVGRTPVPTCGSTTPCARSMSRMPPGGTVEARLATAAGYPGLPATCSRCAMVIRSEPSRIASAAAPLSKREISPVSPVLAARTNCTIVR